MEAVNKNMIHELLWGKCGKVHGERQYADSIHAQFFQKLTSLIYGRQETWMSTWSDDLARMRIEGDDHGRCVKGVRILNSATDNRAMPAMNPVKDTDAHH